MVSVILDSLYCAAVCSSVQIFDKCLISFLLLLFDVIKLGTVVLIDPNPTQSLNFFSFVFVETDIDESVSINQK